MIRSWDDCVDLGYGRGRAERSTAEAIWRIDADLGRPADVNEAWRSPEQANANRARWLAYERYLNGGPWAPRAPYALGADDSVHCSGEAADSDDWYDPDAAAVWRRHGFRQTARYPGTPRDEPWHGEHRREWEQAGAKPATATPTQKGPLMALSDAEQAELLNTTRQLYNAMFNGGPAMGDQKRSVAFSLGNITEFLDRIDQRVLALFQAAFDGGPSMPDDGKSIGQSLAEIRADLAEVRAHLPSA